MRYGIVVTAVFVGFAAELISFLFAATWYADDIYTSRFTGLSAAPFQAGPVPIPYPEHRLRLLGPVLAWAVGLHGVAGTLIPVAANIPLLGMVYAFVRNRCSIQMGLISTVLLATTHLTMTSRTLLGYHDSLVFLCCLASLLSRNSLGRAGWLFLALYGDVRALLTCPFLIIWPRSPEMDSPSFNEMAKRVVVCASTAALWYLSAMWLLHALDYHQYTSSRVAEYLNGRYLELIKPGYLQLSSFMTFKAAWLWMLVGVWWFWRQHWLKGAYVAVVVFSICSSSLLVADLSRSLTFCFPAILLGLTGHWRYRSDMCVTMAGTCLALNLITPFYQGMTYGLWVISYPLPVQVVKTLAGQ